MRSEKCLCLPVSQRSVSLFMGISVEVPSLPFNSYIYFPAALIFEASKLFFYNVSRSLSVKLIYFRPSLVSKVFY